MTKLRPNQKIWAEIELLKNGQLKVVKANKLVGLNQHKNVWKPTIARETARLLNRSSLLIK